MAKRYVLSEADRDKLDGLLDSPPQSPRKRSVRAQAARHALGGIRFKNSSGEEMPPFAVMQCDGATLDRESPYINAVKPASEGSLFLLNGPRAIPSNGYGRGFREGRALVDGSSASAWFMPVAGEWSLAPGGAVFDHIALLGDGTGYFFLSNNAGIIGKTDASHAKGATGTINLYSATSSPLGTTITATNLFADLEADKWVIALFINGIWYLIAGEC